MRFFWGGASSCEPALAGHQLSGPASAGHTPAEQLLARGEYTVGRGPVTRDQLLCCTPASGLLWPGKTRLGRSLQQPVLTDVGDVLAVGPRPGRQEASGEEGRMPNA